MVFLVWLRVSTFYTLRASNADLLACTGMGLVASVCKERELQNMSGHMAVGHVRYVDWGVDWGIKEPSAWLSPSLHLGTRPLAAMACSSASLSWLTISTGKLPWHTTAKWSIRRALWK